MPCIKNERTEANLEGALEWKTEQNEQMSGYWAKLDLNDTFW